MDSDAAVRTEAVVTHDNYDVAVIGAGAVGSATASALVRAGFQVLLLEAGQDVGAGTSKANTAIWHTGFDAKPGTMEARLVARGYQLLAQRAEAFNWPLERVGAVLVAWDSEQRSRLDDIQASARAVGYQRINPLTVDEVYQAEPHLGPGVTGGLAVPDEGLLDPWSITLALASDAVRNGATLLTNARVERAVRDDGFWSLDWPTGSARARWVINAAGLRSDEV
ncbi:MAG: NAD(P)/FAD-dependent oxidoreductase, partial [Actinomycetales bacterium]